MAGRHRDDNQNWKPKDATQSAREAREIQEQAQRRLEQDYGLQERERGRWGR